MSGAAQQDFINGYKKFSNLSPNNCRKDEVLHIIDIAQYFFADTSEAGKAITQETINAMGVKNFTDEMLCNMAVSPKGDWETDNRLAGHVQEAKRRGLSCGVDEAATIQSASSVTKINETNNYYIGRSDKFVCAKAEELDVFGYTDVNAYTEAKRRNLKCGIILRSNSWVIIEACSVWQLGYRIWEQSIFKNTCS